MTGVWQGRTDPRVRATPGALENKARSSWTPGSQPGEDKRWAARQQGSPARKTQLPVSASSGHISFTQRFPSCLGVFQPKQDFPIPRQEEEVPRESSQIIRNEIWATISKQAAFGVSWPLAAGLVPGHLQENGLLESLETDREESHSQPSPQTT